MAVKTKAQLTTDNAAVITGQTIPESINPTSLGGLTQDVIDSMWNKGDSDLNRTQAFADLAGRGAAVPDFIGQFAYQVDTKITYTSFGLSAGNWNPLLGTQTFADATARAAAVPNFVGQIGVQLDTNTIYVSTGLSGGNWVLPRNTQTGSDNYAVAGGIDTYAAILTPALSAYATGNSFKILFTNANTGAATLNINALGVINLKKNGATTLSAGDIVAGKIYTVTYDGTNFQI